MVRAGGGLGIFGDADVPAQHSPDHEWNAGWKLHVEQYDDKPEQRSRGEQLVLQLYPNRLLEIHIQSDNHGNADDPDEQPSEPDLNGYVGGVMLTATGGTPDAPTGLTKPYVITNVTGTPGDVGIFLPGDSSEMLAVFNVKSLAAPAAE